MKLMMEVGIVLVILTFGNAWASDEALPPDVVIAAIQEAVAENPGLIKEVEVEREGGRLFVEVKMINASGREIKVKIDPETLRRQSTRNSSRPHR